MVYFCLILFAHMSNENMFKLIKLNMTNYRTELHNGELLFLSKIVKYCINHSIDGILDKKGRK